MLFSRSRKTDRYWLSIQQFKQSDAPVLFARSVWGVWCAERTPVPWKFQQNLVLVREVQYSSWEWVWSAPGTGEEGLFSVLGLWEVVLD